jgi:hypothetical protein
MRDVVSIDGRQPRQSASTGTHANPSQPKSCVATNGFCVARRATAEDAAAPPKRRSMSIVLVRRSEPREEHV